MKAGLKNLMLVKDQRLVQRSNVENYSHLNDTDKKKNPQFEFFFSVQNYFISSLSNRNLAYNHRCDRFVISVGRHFSNLINHFLS